MLHCRCVTGFWICLRFWICQHSEYSRVLNMPGFWIYHSFKYVKLTQGSKYAWINPGYIWLYLNVPKFVWTAFVLHSSIAILYIKKPKTVFLESKLDSFYSSCNYLILVFAFRLSIFTNKVSNLLLPLETEGARALNLTGPVRYPINISMLLF